MGFLAILNAEFACIKVVLIVGANVPTMSGKDTEKTNASLNVCEEKKNSKQ